jgi:hypothetical protein
MVRRARIVSKSELMAAMLLNKILRPLKGQVDKRHVKRIKFFCTLSENSIETINKIKINKVNNLG